MKLHSYTAPGAEHTVLDHSAFYTETVNGESLVDWIRRLIAREPLDDVHCTSCRAG